MTSPPVLAHPLTQQAELPVSPLVLALLAVYVLVMVAAAGRRWLLPRPHPQGDPSAWAPDGQDVPSGGPLPLLFWSTRALGLALFVLAIIAARFGHPSQLANIAPLLTVGAGWPMVTLGALLLGRVWWWLNPFDTLARPIAELGAGRGSARTDDDSWAPVWWALAPAALWLLYLTVWDAGLAPRSIGWVLIVYTLATLAGCLALGRTTWLWRGELFTVFFGLLSTVRVRGTRWAPPRGAPALLGLVAGGALFGLLRISELGGFLADGPRLRPFAPLIVVALMAVAAVLADRGARRAGPATVVVGLAPMTTALVVALALERGRLATSLQLLPIRASDPLGRGLDLLGTAGNGIDPAPLGAVGQVWVQAAVLLAGAVAGVLLALRSAQPVVPQPGMRPQPARHATGIVVPLLGTFLAIGVAVAATI